MTDNGSSPATATLLPCPFCGQNPCQRWEKNPNGAPYPDHHIIWCENLDCSINAETFEETAEESIKVWNTRASQPATRRRKTMAHDQLSAGIARPVAYRWRWKDVFDNNPWRLVHDASGISQITAQIESLYLDVAQALPRQCECLGGSTYNDGDVRRCDLCGLPVPSTPCETVEQMQAEVAAQDPEAGFSDADRAAITSPQSEAGK